MEAIAEETRRIYHAQHQRIVGDKKAMARFIAMFSDPYFGVPPGYFQGKRVLDAGCGDTMKLIIALHRMGCRDLSGFDLGTDFMQVAGQSLKGHGIDPATINLKSGSMLGIPYESESFDFVCCHGVMVHQPSIAEVERGFNELARVTKPGGSLYTVFGVVGGLFEDCLFPALRAYYRKNAEFKKLIDALSPGDFGAALTSIEETIGTEEGAKEMRTIKGYFLRQWFDTDLCVTIQNILQAPVRLTIDEEMIRRMYAQNGFGPPRRLKRYIRRSNIRRFFAPLHYLRGHWLGTLLYGSGNLEFIAEKH